MTSPIDLPLMRVFNASAVLPPRGQELFHLPPGFAEGTPVDLEIGCGVGWHPITYAQANPTRFLIAIEHTREKFARFQSRLQRHKTLPNLLAVHADAVAWITHCLGQQSIDRCFILYPNPNPKAPSKRWVRMPFFQRLIDHLSPHGEIIITTNEMTYRNEVELYASSTWKLDISKNITLTADHQQQGVPRTHFEKKYLARGQTCYEMGLKNPNSSRLPIKQQ